MFCLVQNMWILVLMQAHHSTYIRGNMGQDAGIVREKKVITGIMLP